MYQGLASYAVMIPTCHPSMIGMLQSCRIRQPQQVTAACNFFPAVAFSAVAALRAKNEAWYKNLDFVALH